MSLITILGLQQVEAYQNLQTGYKSDSEVDGLQRTTDSTNLSLEKNREKPHSGRSSFEAAHVSTLLNHESYQQHGIIQDSLAATPAGNATQLNIDSLTKSPDIISANIGSDSDVSNVDDEMNHRGEPSTSNEGYAIPKLRSSITSSSDHVTKGSHRNAWPSSQHTLTDRSKRFPSISRISSASALTDKEHLLLLEGEIMLKEMRKLIETCIDISTTLDVCQERDPRLKPVVAEVRKEIKVLQPLLEKNVAAVEPHIGKINVASFAVNELFISNAASSTSLSTLAFEFALVDIYPMTLEARWSAWHDMTSTFADQ